MPTELPLRFQRPTFPDPGAIEQYFKVSRSQAWYSNGGPCLDEFARRIGQRAGAAALPLANATIALTLAMAALRRPGLGSVVLLPSFTFPAAAQAAIWNGMEPVFIDILPGHLHLDPDRLAKALEDLSLGVGLVVAGSSFGTPPPPEVRTAWERLCHQAGVPLVVDSAAGFPARGADGVPIGAQGDAEVVSFHITKPFGIGEGGAVFSRDAELVDRIGTLANFGYLADRSITDAHATNAKLDELHAAVGLAVLDEIDGRIASRRASACRLLESIGSAYEPQLGGERGTHQFVSVLAPTPRERQQILERASGRVLLRTYYEPLHRLAAFKALRIHGDLSVTEAVASRIISLPMYDEMSDAELDLISDVVRGS